MAVTNRQPVSTLPLHHLKLQQAGGGVVFQRLNGAYESDKMELKKLIMPFEPSCKVCFPRYTRFD